MAVCKLCSLPITRKSPGIVCVFCCDHYHANSRCSDVSKAQLSVIKELEGTSWRCATCRARSTGSPKVSNMRSHVIAEAAAAEDAEDHIEDDESVGSGLVSRLTSEIRSLRRSVNFCSEKISDFEILKLTLRAAHSQAVGGNIWDMIINDDVNFVGRPDQLTSNYLPPPVMYGQPDLLPSLKAPAYPIASSSNVGVTLESGGTFSPSSIIKPQVEILKLAESFIRLKAEVASRLYAVAVDNWDTIVYLFNAVVNNIGTLSAFTVNGIIVLRKILEVAGRLISSWQITVPNVNVDFSTLLRESNFYNNIQ